MNRRPTSVRVIFGVAVVAFVAGALTLDAQPAKPDYKRYAEFAPEDTQSRIAVKRAYNEAAQSYNQALYDYYVTLEKHDRLVEVHANSSVDAAERKRARDQAQTLRVKLADLGRLVTTRAATVDQASRRAAELGVSTP
ncbi:MAG: hypothetical protein ACRELA_12530 [Candidatus Rokuibacteriota bacterium]